MEVLSWYMMTITYNNAISVHIKIIPVKRSIWDIIFSSSSSNKCLHYYRSSANHENPKRFALHSLVVASKRKGTTTGLSIHTMTTGQDADGSLILWTVHWLLSLGLQK
jgi:hypothetical protein